MKLRQAVEHYITLKQSLGFRFATDTVQITTESDGLTQRH